MNTQLNIFYIRNGFPNVSVGESTGYGGLGHAHPQPPPPQQQETVQSHPQPSPRPLNQQIPQENQQPSNGPNVSNQQQIKQTAPTQQQPTSTTEGQRSEGSK